MTTPDTELREALRALADEWEATYERWKNVTDAPKVQIHRAHANRLRALLDAAPRSEGERAGCVCGRCPDCRRYLSKLGRPSPEDMSDAEGDAWDALHDDSDVICTCDGCNYYSPTYDHQRECSLNTHIEAVVSARLANRLGLDTFIDALNKSLDFRPNSMLAEALATAAREVADAGHWPPSPAPREAVEREALAEAWLEGHGHRCADEGWFCDNPYAAPAPLEDDAEGEA